MPTLEENMQSVRTFAEEVFGKQKPHVRGQQTAVQRTGRGRVAGRPRSRPLAGRSCAFTIFGTPRPGTSVSVRIRRDSGGVIHSWPGAFPSPWCHSCCQTAVGDSDA
jgi:hypothetical protein